MSKRDEFSQSTREAVAARAGWHCSLDGCRKLTVGPSEESPEAITKLGDVAHICAAASGTGSRRYDPSMAPTERSGIGNAIWLCTDHARLIDRDEMTYTADSLRGMKRRHEAEVARAVRAGAGMNLGKGLLAVGPNVVCTGDVSEFSAGSWTLDLKHSMIGDLHALVSFIDGFAKAPLEDRYVLSNELGDGRVLQRAPTLQRRADGYGLICPVLPSFARIDAQRLGDDLAVHPETNDWYLDDEGNIALVSGADALLQSVQTLFSMQRGESPFYPTSGARFFEYFEAFQGSPWLEKLLMLDVVRQAAIPYSDRMLGQERLPLPCVLRVRGVELLADSPADHRLPVRFDLDVQGVGRWQRDVRVYMPTREQMDEIRRRQALTASIWEGVPPP